MRDLRARWQLVMENILTAGSHLALSVCVVLDYSTNLSACYGTSTLLVLMPNAYYIWVLMWSLSKGLKHVIGLMARISILTFLLQIYYSSRTV